MATKTKRFDCVAMKRRGAERVRRATQGMTREEEFAFWARGTEELLREQRILRQTETRQGPQGQAS